jgi:hypothetical protein
MFEGADTKLQDARTAVARLSSMISAPIETNIRIISGPSGIKNDSFGIRDPFAFKECFSSCMVQVRSIGDAILKNKEALELPCFVKWKKNKISFCKTDDLMTFINDRRNDDIHEGNYCLQFTMNSHVFSSENVGDEPTPSSVLRIDAKGPYWVVDKGTPDERIETCKNIDGLTFTASIINPPVMHNGNPLKTSDPVTIYNLALHYYADLLWEAKNKFGK